MTRNKLPKVKTKTKKTEQKKLSKQLYNLLSDTEVISDGERIFWLENYPCLSSEKQDELAQVIISNEKELRHENDAHMNRVAEIDTKCLSQLQKFARANGVKAFVGDDDNLDDYDEDEIIKTLQQEGEL